MKDRTSHGDGNLRLATLKTPAHVRERVNRKMAELRLSRRLAHQCVRCGTPLADDAPAGGRCTDCKELHRAREVAAYRAGKRKVPTRPGGGYMQERRIALKALGLCTDCTVNAARDGKPTCAECYAKHLAATREYGRRKRRAAGVHFRGNRKP